MAHASGDWSWLLLADRSSDEWQAGLEKFFGTIFEGTYALETASCPCLRCRGGVYKIRSKVEIDLLTKGFDQNFVKEKLNSQPCNDMATYDGAADDASAGNDLVSALIRAASGGNDREEPNEEAKKFFALLKEAQQVLGEGSRLTKLSFMVRLFQLKCMSGWSNNSTGQALELFSNAFPPGHCILDTYEKARKIIRDLWLTYIKIHACVNDCVLFRGTLLIWTRAQHVVRVDGRTTTEDLMKMATLAKVLGQKRSELLAKFYGIFHLYLDCKDYIYQRKHHH